MGYKRATLAEFRAELGRVKCPCEGWSDCIQFAGTRGANGYNLFRTVLPSTVAVYLVTGRFPSTVTRRCENPNCVNFAHMVIHPFKDSGPRLLGGNRVSKGTHSPTLSELVAILYSRPESGRKYSLDDLVRNSGISDKRKIKQALRLAPAFDVGAEVHHLRGKQPLDKLLIPINEPLPFPLD